MKNFMKKIAIALMLVMTFALCFAFVGCGDNEESNVNPCKTHDWELVTNTATCIEDGLAKYKCANCGEEKEETAKATLKHEFVNKKCKFCLSPIEPLEVVSVWWDKLYSGSEYINIEGLIKNVSPLRIKSIKVSFYLITETNGKREIVAQNYSYVTSSIYMEPSSTLDFRCSIRCTQEWSLYALYVEVPTFDGYTLMYDKSLDYTKT